MSILTRIAGRIYVIGLTERQDRRAAAEKQMSTIGLKPDEWQFFDAYGVNNPPPERYTKGISDFVMSGWWGNKFSHYAVIEKAREAGLKSVMVFEDDVILHPEFDRIVSNAITELAGRICDWFHLGGNHRYFSDPAIMSPIDGMPYNLVNGVVPVSHHLSIILKMQTAHAYLAMASVYDFILENAIASPLSIDGFYAHEVHSRFRCYCVSPCVASQAPGMNDIGNCFSDYTQYIGD